MKTFKAISWLALGWGTLACLALAYFIVASRLGTAPAPRTALLAQSGIALVAGLPAWVALPALALASRRSASAAWRATLLVPSALAVVCVAMLAVTSGL